MQERPPFLKSKKVERTLDTLQALIYNHRLYIADVFSIPAAAHSLAAAGTLEKIRIRTERHKKN